MPNTSYSPPAAGKPPAGPERELLKLLDHAAPEVRGLSAMLTGKLAAAMPLDVSVTGAIARLAVGDTDARVRRAAAKALAGIGRRKPGGSTAVNGEALIPPHGGYEELASYQMAEIAFDGTAAFCDRFISIRSRTHDQMVQAARSGKQNIVEGSMASGTSKKTEIKLVGVARASLEELLKDYHDFLRTRKLPVWEKNDPRAKAIRRIAFDEDRSYSSYRSYVEQAPPESAANTLVCVIHQANFLLDRQLKALEAAFLAEGGFTERLYQARRARRAQSNA